MLLSGGHYFWGVVTFGGSLLSRSHCFGGSLLLRSHYFLGGHYFQGAVNLGGCYFWGSLLLRVFTIFFPFLGEGERKGALI